MRNPRSAGAAPALRHGARTLADAPGRGYDGVAKTLHWLVFALMLAQFVVAIAMPPMRRGTVPGTLINLHFSLGIVILLAVALRWLWRIGHPVPLATSELPEWEQKTARAMHALLYALLVVSPILGWAAASAREFAVTLFGLATLPPLVAARSRIGFLAGDVHKVLSWTLFALIGLHILAALYHHFGRRDGVLQRMLPGSRA